MEKINRIEKGGFVKLFNRGGYVLDFNTSDFDAFTMESIGVALCRKYNQSKGKSLIAYTNDANEDDVIKLFADLLEYYEGLYRDFKEETKEGGKYTELYLKCRTVINRLSSDTKSISHYTDGLKEKFSSEYLSSHIDLMMKMQRENPTEAIGKAKELIESCCTTILEANEVSVDKNWDVNKLFEETTKHLKINPKDISEDRKEVITIKSILQSLKTITNNIAHLRNSYGSGHGKSASYKGLEERHAKLAVGSSVTLVHFLWDSHERRNKK